MSIALIGLTVKSFKEGQNREYDLFLRKISIKNSLAHVRAYFESWVKYLRLSLVIPKTLRETLEFKIFYRPWDSSSFTLVRHPP
jgi:hypothetical protein